MKKFAITLTAIVVLASVAASLTWAKVSDFNALINDNISAQKELHGEIKKQVQASDQAFRDSLEKREASSMVVESDQTQINSPTSQKMLKFKKEKKQATVSRKKQMDRISQEFDDASTSF